MLAAVLSLTVLGVTLGYLLGVASRYFKVDVDPRVAEVEALMPGSQCGQCGYPGCTQAAIAIVNGEAPLTVCPPGGKALVESLAKTLGVKVDTSGMVDTGVKIARVKESLCIGCIKCMRNCPTDAIVGAPKQIHVVMERACTGCAACVEDCPTGALSMVPEKPSLRGWRWSKPDLAKAA